MLGKRLTWHSEFSHLHFIRAPRWVLRLKFECQIQLKAKLALLPLTLPLPRHVPLPLTTRPTISLSHSILQRPFITQPLRFVFTLEYHNKQVIENVTIKTTPIHNTMRACALKMPCFKSLSDDWIRRKFGPNSHGLTFQNEGYIVYRYRKVDKKHFK